MRTEVGVFPNDWPLTPLKRISPKQRVGLVINPSTYFDKAGTVALLVGSNVSENVIDATAANRITAASNAMLAASRLAAGDLVTVRVGEPGVTAVVPPELNGSNCASMMIVRRHSSFNSHWLCAVMNSPLGRQQVEHVQYGTAQKQFNIGDAIDFQFATPPLAEQEAIAATLGDVDALLAGLDRLIAKKRGIKQATMQQLLTGQTRLPGFSGEWSDYVLGQLGATYGGLAGKGKADFGQGTARYVPFVNVMANVRIDCNALEAVNVVDSENQNRVLLGDLLFNGSSETPEEIALCSLMNQAVDKLYLNSFCFGFRLTPDAPASALFLTYFMRSQLGRELMKSLAQGSTRYNLSKAALLRAGLKLPDMDEQTAIATVLSDMDAELSAFEARLTKTRALKEGMTQELLTGKTRLI